MNKRNPRLSFIIILTALITLMVALFFGNLSLVKANPGGLDFLAHWQGSRAFILDGTNPYSDQAAALIESGTRELTLDSTNNYRFVSPLFSLLFLAPVAVIGEFTIARAVWMTLLEGMVLLSAYLMAGWLVRKRTGWITLFVILVLLFNLATVTALLDGSMAIIGFSAIILTIHFILKKQDELAGLMLAFSLVKPDLVLPILLVLFVWLLIKKRFTVLTWFLGTFGLLLGFSLVLNPAWLKDYFATVIEYSMRNPVRVEEWQPTALEIRLVLVKNLAIVLLLIVEWFRVNGSGEKRLIWITGLLFAVVPWLGRSILLENTIFIYPALLIGLGYLGGIRGNRSSPGILGIALLLSVSGWLLSGNLIPGIAENWGMIWNSVVLPFVALIILYWSRWWVIRQEKFSEDQFKLT
jgi:uncharacterized membrane-anchored protein YitT (DUF2179 family)